MRLLGLILLPIVTMANDVVITRFTYRQWTLADVSQTYCQDHEKILRTYDNGNPPPDRLQGVNCSPDADAINDGSFLTNGLTTGQVELHFTAEPGYSYWVQWKPIGIEPPVVVQNGSYGTSWQPISTAITVQAAGEYIFKSGTVEKIAFFRILKSLAH